MEYLFQGDINGRIMIPTPIGEVDILPALKNSLVSVSGKTANDIQLAVDKAKETGNGVFIPYAIYDIDKSIKLPSNIQIVSNGAVLRSRINQPAGEGNYSQRIFENTDPVNGNENISITGIVFDGNRDSATVGAGAYDHIDSLVYFEKVTHITVEKCIFKNHTSNWITLESELPFYGFGCGVFFQCSDIEFISNESYNHRTEGFMFIECNTVMIDRLYSKNETIWTSLHTWFCDGVTLKDSYIFENNASGSTINMYSTNMTIENNYIEGGSGLDFGNETGTPFTIENITIKNNIIKSLGVNAMYGSPSELKKKIKILGNYLEGVSEVLRLGLSIDVEIAGNKIVSTSQTGTGIGIKEGVENCHIHDNNIQASLCIFIGNVPSQTHKNIQIHNNTLKSFPLNGNSSFNYGSCVYMKHHNSVTDLRFKEIMIHNNIMSAEGSFVFSQFDIQPAEANFIVIENNIMKSETVVCERGISIAFSKNVKVCGNIIDGFFKTNFSNIENLFICLNKFLYSLGVQNANPINFGGSMTGYGEVIENYSSLETYDLIRGGHTFTKYKIQDNTPEKYYSDCVNSRYGTTAQRPTSPVRYHIYFDTTLGKPIWWNGSVWKDSAGTTV